MLVWDPLLEKYLAFGTLKSAALGKLMPAISRQQLPLTAIPV